MRHLDHPNTTESLIQSADLDGLESLNASAALEAMERDRALQPEMDGLNDEPTSPRENPPIDEGRVARAREDFDRVLGG